MAGARAGKRDRFRAGFGLFYDHVPLNVYTFNRYPDQVVTIMHPTARS